MLGDTDRDDLLCTTGGAAVVECVACRGGGRWTAVVACSLELIRVRLQWWWGGRALLQEARIHNNDLCRAVIASHAEVNDG